MSWAVHVMVPVAACLVTGVITWRIWPSPRAAYSLLVFGVLFVASAEYGLSTPVASTRPDR